MESNFQYPPTSSLTIPILPAELVTEILSRLPVKSLLRFKCVSELWLALICSPEFVKTHLSLSANNKDYSRHKVMMYHVPKYSFKDCSLMSLFNESVTEAFDLNFPMKFNGLDRNKKKKYPVWIMGSVNGLIYLVNEDDMFLWNPSTRKYKKLPDPRLTLRYIFLRMCGFGYDELHDDYKVVIFINNSSHDEVKIYSLKSDSWKNVDACPSMVHYVPGKFVNGKLHWVTFTQNIISIDLTGERWGEMEIYVESLVCPFSKTKVGKAKITILLQITCVVLLLVVLLLLLY
uniref:F-box/kelch-repeat protein At3g06240-like n=1 Tax=Nicotiana tabacum TaxID=4097 RepID=A0A1S3ZUQ4_TOBAC|nr:PREDICTED: F-box/kelch-repeat protein At3g06240-like [Nicotiana tabacum]XP_018623139.2 F-box/kelch-repeat protein At3g06240-like isoform X1 [Nicotiana tomentosiformis]